jgi:Transcriptional regulatory protein, C terminal/FHA domain
MESRSAANVIVSAPDGALGRRLDLAGDRVTVGRLPELNDIALEPDPEHLVTRAEHCAFERSGSTWAVVDGGSVNGTYVRRAGELKRVEGRLPLRDGDVVCILGTLDHQDGAGYFELEFEATADSQATRAAPRPEAAEECLSYEADEARLVLVSRGERHELHIRAQAHKLVAYMAERSPSLCTHAELMDAVWGDEPMHSREELAKIVWELRKQLEPYGAGHLIENERGLGYRLRTCP